MNHRLNGVSHRYTMYVLWSSHPARLHWNSLNYPALSSRPDLHHHIYMYCIALFIKHVNSCIHTCVCTVYRHCTCTYIVHVYLHVLGMYSYRCILIRVHTEGTRTISLWCNRPAIYNVHVYVASRKPSTCIPAVLLT